VTLANS
jgi:hypothetical protein